MNNGEKVLKLAYLLGAVSDAVVFLVMVFPQFATAFWGFETFSEQYYFAMGTGAPLMIAWTFLLLWAYKKPFERRTVAVLTMVVIVGIAVTNIVMISRCLFAVTDMIPSFATQAMLLVLFGVGYVFTKAGNLASNTVSHVTSNI